MAQEVTNFARFYASFNQLPYSGDRESFKREIVRQYTWGRTESLKEMTIAEYNACCEGLEKLTGRKEEQKKKRSTYLIILKYNNSYLKQSYIGKKVVKNVVT